MNIFRQTVIWNVTQMNEVADDTTTPRRTERLARSVDQESAVGWTPGITDWLTGKARPVGSRGT